MNSSRKWNVAGRAGAVAIAMLAIGWLWQEVFAATAVASVEEPRGGMRRVLADFAWLGAYVKWEQRDAAGTETLLQLTTRLDARPLYFWINGARMIANDFGQWEAAPTANAGAISPNREAQCARRALRFLDDALAQHPRSPELWIERGNIEYVRLRNFSAAAASYRAAALLPDAPYYAARLHAEMLRRAGRKAEALAFLRQLYPTLPHDNESAAAGLVRERIRALEGELRQDQTPQQL